MYVLEKQWQGEIAPYERSCRKNSPVQKLNDALAEKSKALESAMSQEARSLWADYSDLRSGVESLSCEDAYIEGVRFGILLMPDVLGGNNGNFTDSRSVCE